VLGIHDITKLHPGTVPLSIQAVDGAWLSVKHQPTLTPCQSAFRFCNVMAVVALPSELDFSITPIHSTSYTVLVNGRRIRHKIG
jgi:hypothetical protein